MANTIKIPTSSDIYLEADGKKIAVVQSYKATARKSERTIEAFGEAEPVATITNQPVYNIVLTRLYATDSAISDGISFYSLTDFSLVIAKPDKRIIYTGCNWSEISESGEVSQNIAEKVTLVATGRVETKA